MNVSEKSLSKVSRLVIKKQLTNPKIKLSEPGIQKNVFPFIYSIAQNQRTLYYNPTPEKFELNSVTSDEDLNILIFLIQFDCALWN